MARPKKDGLLYFSFDTDFFYADNRIKALRARYGCDGLVFYIYLLTEIYRNGYYLVWNEDSEDNALSDLNLSSGLIKQVMEFLVNRSLLTSILVNSDTIITSPGIQKRFQEAVKGLKRDIFVLQEVWLLDSSETATHIKVTQNYGFSEKNEDKSEKNESKSEKNSTNEMKQNKTSNIIVASSGEPKATAPFFEEGSFEIRCVDMLIKSCLETFPNSKVPVGLKEKQKWAIEIERMKRLDKRSESEIMAALNFAVSDSFWKPNIRSGKKFREKFETLIIQSKGKRGNTKNQFNRIEQHDYDFDAIEKDLLGN